MGDLTGFSRVEDGVVEDGVEDRSFAGAGERAWRRALAHAVRDPDELLDILGLPEPLRAGARRAAAIFPLVVPRGFIARMRPGDPHDPLLRQVLPLDVEAREVEGYVRDPVGDHAALLAPGLLQKYHGRALLIASGSCAVNCRYCFRRSFPYDTAPRGLDAWRPALAGLAADHSVTEVILSGGDPLVLTDRSLATLVGEIAALRHVRRLRIHSRLPVVLPERITSGLMDLLAGSRLTPLLVIHANHPAELEGDCGEGIGRLAGAGVHLLNQSVLLRGVNDAADTLARLSERLIDLRVLPYYLHQLDPVAGAAHFHVPPERGLEIVAELRRRLPGYAVPRYVKEVAGAASKVPIG
jgi:EF-P beta-lysylation protein EpmB